MKGYIELTELETRTRYTIELHTAIKDIEKGKFNPKWYQIALSYLSDKSFNQLVTLLTSKNCPRGLLFVIPDSGTYPHSMKSLLEQVLKGEFCPRDLKVMLYKAWTKAAYIKTTWNITDPNFIDILDRINARANYNYQRRLAINEALEEAKIPNDIVQSIFEYYKTEYPEETGLSNLNFFAENFHTKLDLRRWFILLKNNLSLTFDGIYKVCFSTSNDLIITFISWDHVAEFETSIDIQTVSVWGQDPAKAIPKAYVQDFVERYGKIGMLEETLNTKNSCSLM